MVNVMGSSGQFTSGWRTPALGSRMGMGGRRRPGRSDLSVGRGTIAQGDSLSRAGRLGPDVASGDVSPNGYGIFDIVGNVWEWTRDCAPKAYEAAAQ